MALNDPVTTFENPYTTPTLSGKVTGIVQVYNESDSKWYSLVDPMAMSRSVYDIDAGGSTGRNLNGDMLRDRVKIVEKIEMEFPPMWEVDENRMLSLTSEEFFQCRFKSLKTGAYRTMEMYVGDRADSVYYDYTMTKRQNGQARVTGLKFNFIER